MALKNISCEEPSFFVAPDSELEVAEVALVGVGGRAGGVALRGKGSPEGPCSADVPLPLALCLSE